MKVGVCDLEKKTWYRMSDASMRPANPITSDFGMETIEFLARKQVGGN